MSPLKAQPKFSFAQGLQLYFIQRILDEHTMSTFFGDDNTNKFFIQWSNIVRNGIKKSPHFPFCINVPENFGKSFFEKPEAEISFIKEQMYREAYKPLLINLQYSMSQSLRQSILCRLNEQILVFACSFASL